MKSTVPPGQVSKLMPAIGRVLELVQSADSPMAQTIALRDAANGLMIDSVLGIGPDSFQELARAARNLEEPLKLAAAEAEILVEVARQRLLEDAVLADEDQMRIIERHRARLAREKETHLRVLKLVREMAITGDVSGSVVVEVRLVGRTLARHSG